MSLPTRFQPMTAMLSRDAFAHGVLRAMELVSMTFSHSFEIPNCVDQLLCPSWPHFLNRTNLISFLQRCSLVWTYGILAKNSPATPRCLYYLVLLYFFSAEQRNMIECD